MKPITITMINIYKMTNIDMMGYFFDKTNASYHHLIIPKRLGGKETVENGSVLNETSSHPYLHLIENRDKEIFDRITLNITLEKQTGRIDIDYLKKIRELLMYFEKDRTNETNSKGKSLIKEEYKKRLIL